MATFSVNDQVRRDVTVGDGSTVSFPFSFQVNATTDVKVYVDDTLKVAGTHYDIVDSADSAGLNSDGTGKVKFKTTPTDYTPANNAMVTVVSEVPVARTSVYTAGGNITAASLESDFDTITMQVGDREQEIARAILGPLSDPTSTSMILPDKDTRRNKYLAFDNNGGVTCLAGTTAILGQVDTGQLVDDAVISSKIADNAITSSLLATNAVTATKLANDAVTSAAIADDAVTQAAVADDAIGTDQIANGAVTAAKLATGAAFVSGMVMPFAGTSAPTGWLLAYGQAVSRTTYADLFTAIGTIYGSGDGSSTFNVPDLRGRVVAGQDDMGGTSADRLTDFSGGLNGDNLGSTGGSEKHQLDTTEIPSHSHSMGSNTRVQVGFDNGTAFAGRTTSGSVGPITYSTQSTGGGGAHNNVQPTIILNYIIKT